MQPEHQTSVFNCLGANRQRLPFLVWETSVDWWNSGCTVGERAGGRVQWFRTFCPATMWLWQRESGALWRSVCHVEVRSGPV